MQAVLHILSSLNLGGAEKLTVDLAHVQRANGLDAQILSLGSSSDFLVDVVNSREVPIIYSDKSKSRLSRYIDLFKVFKRFDVIHVHSRGAFRFTAPIIPFLAGCRIIYTRHGLFPDDSTSLKVLYTFLRPFIAYITFVTESGREVFVANHKWNSKNLTVVRNGVFVPEIFKSLPKQPIRFGSVGRMVPVKRQVNLLEAIEKLDLYCQKNSDSKMPFSLKFYGDGPLEPILRKIAMNIRDGIVEFRGEERDIEKIYEEIDVLVVASESEGLSMVIMEAMARGIPVIATDVGGNPTLVRDHETGILVKNQSSEALYDAMLQILDDESLISNLGLAARELIRNEFSLLNTHKEYLECYAIGAR